MPVEFHWLIEPHLLLLTYSGTVTMDDLRGANAFIQRSLEQHPTVTLQTISDNSRLEHASISVWDMQEMFTIFSYPNFGWMVVCCIQRKPARFLTRLAIKILSIQAKIVPDLDAARAFLVQVDPTLQIHIQN